MHIQTKIDLQNMTNLFRALVQSVNDMIYFLQKENKLLSRGSVSDASRMLDQKCKILEHFQDVESQIRTYMQEYAANGDSRIKKLIDKAKERYILLSNLMKENEILLESNIRVGERMIALYNAVKVDQLIKQSSYNKDGEIAVKKDIEKIMPAISVNSRI